MLSHDSKDSKSITAPTPLLAPVVVASDPAAVATAAHDIKSDLVIKTKIDPNQLPPEVDFWVFGKNALVISNNCDFKADVAALGNEYQQGDHIGAVSVDLKDHNMFSRQRITDDPWFRDVITLKTKQTMFVGNQLVRVQEYRSHELSSIQACGDNNRNVSKYVRVNDYHPRELNVGTEINDKYMQPLQVAAQCFIPSLVIMKSGMKIIFKWC